MHATRRAATDPGAAGVLRPHATQLMHRRSLLPKLPGSRAALLALAAACSVIAFTACGGGENPAEPTITVLVAPGTQQRVAGETQQFAATVNGSAPTAGQVTWSSSDVAVATVDATTGMATAVAAGTAKIRATVGSKTGEANLTVIANTAPVVNAGPDLDATHGGTVSLLATGTDAEAQALSYRWTQIAGPDVTGGTGRLSGATPSFTAPGAPTVIGFSVVASDPTLASTADSVYVYVLEDKTKAVWVRAGATGTADGSRAAPYATIADAIAAATATGADLYIAEGEYPGVTLATGVSLYGGFATDWKARHPVTTTEHRTIVRGSGTGVLGTNVADLTIDGLVIEGLRPVASGASAYGVRLLTPARVVISRNVITAEDGAAGAAGAAGVNGQNGVPGVSAATRLGGDGRGPASNGYGGKGGDGGTAAMAGQPGATGTGVGGGAGGAGAPNGTTDGGSAGSNGAHGARGTDGGGATAGGAFSAGAYVANRAGAGTSGVTGAGGGGGGGGRNVYVFLVGDYNGGGGGGGGGGGIGGMGGQPGGSGGASLGVLLVEPTAVALTDNVITSGNGGAGGAGGFGGAGGIGAPGGEGFDPSPDNDGRHGGPGGYGGYGGTGGRGGGGSGGPTSAIVAVGGTYTNTNNTLTVGAGGAGGLPNGEAGWSKAVYY